MKNISFFFIWIFSIFRGEIFYILEQACFRNTEWYIDEFVNLNADETISI